MKNIHIILFYKFERIKSPEIFAKKHLRFCKKLGVLGKVLVAEEGINGSISGTKKQIEEYKKFVWSQGGFKDVWFKEEVGNNHPFTKMFVRIKKEIIRLDSPVDMAKKGAYISPKELLTLYHQGENFITLDTRNYYEYNLGKFKKAVNPNIKSFRDFPKFVEKFIKVVPDKRKKIITYCTGGIRCEKASAYLKEQGFTNVFQLEGGIINFCQQFPDTLWEGKCFVFDKRLMSDLNCNNQPITFCVGCSQPCDLYRNCKNLSCDRLHIMCVACQEKMQGCCSGKCQNEFNVYARKRAALKKEGTWKPPRLMQQYAK